MSVGIQGQEILSELNRDCVVFSHAWRLNRRRAYSGNSFGDTILLPSVTPRRLSAIAIYKKDTLVGQVIYYSVPSHMWDVNYLKGKNVDLL
ncbi:hypothetical protein TNCV_674901 [Trichonephila clavipes]|nr:hypothetical protein TNCV_674901 [Trichonephila clavipes]